MEAGKKNKTPKRIKVSVVVPNYNHSKFLIERLDSIINQSYKDFELIILDDCSTDNSREIIELYKNNPHISQIVYNVKNTGNTFLQWEKGILLAKGEYVWIAESDDSCTNDFLSEIVPLLDNNKDAVLAFSHTYLIDSQGKKMEINRHRESDGKKLIHKGRKFARQTMTKHNYISNASMVVFRRTAFYTVPKTYQQYRSCGDWFFWTNICIQGQVIEVCKKLNYFRMHDKKVTVNAGKTNNDWLEVSSILSSFIELLQIKGISLRLFRGKWTYDINKSVRPNKKELKMQFPKIYGGSIIDVFLYRLYNITKKIYNITCWRN